MERAATEQTAREEPWPDVAAMVGSETVAGLINGTLGKLELKGGKIGDVGVITLAKVLAQCSSLKELILDENDITDAGVTTLFQVLPQCDSLWKVSLQKMLQMGWFPAFCQPQLTPIAMLFNVQWPD